jgi:hypothetical protein
MWALPTDPENAVDALAVVLCPVELFAPDGDEDELEAVREMMAPMREEVVQRFLAAMRRRKLV